MSFSCFGQFRIPDLPGMEAPFGEEKYIFPVNPGIPGFLAGSMGELRSTHFHAGLDIRTSNMTGVPIRTAMDGYVSRVIIGTFGYGKVVFVAHPNGQTTLYAHLSGLNGKMGNYVRWQQYRQKSFDVDLNFTPDQFPVHQGDTIAFSGNTGGSNGPHLHFEIRDSNNEALNPLRFAFPEITDTYSPVVQKIALKTMDMDSRINDCFGRFEFYVLKNGNSYVFPQPIPVHGNIGIEILAHDIVDINRFYCGINYIRMFADSQQVFSQTIEKINFSETRDILTVLDFKVLKTRNAYFNKLYVDDGNGLAYNQGSVSKGIIHVVKKDIPITIELKDTYGNKSQMRFTLKESPVSSHSALPGPVKKSIDFDVDENTLVISATPCSPGKTNSLTVFSKNEEQEIQPAYGNTNRNVYLINLQKTLPDSVTTCNRGLYFNFKDAIPSGTDYKFYDDLADIQFQKDDLYDTLFLNMSRIEKPGREIFTLGSPTIPLHHPIAITLKLQKQYPIDKKTAVYRVNGKEYDYLGGVLENGKMKFSTQDLGDFTILEDSIPPVIYRTYVNSRGAQFRIWDQLSGIASFEATVNGEWLLMNYDYKTGILELEKPDNSKPLKGDFLLKVVDHAGNQKTYTQKIL